MGVIGIFMVIEVMRIDETSGRSYKVKRKEGLGLSYEKHQLFRLVGGNEKYQD